MAILDGSNAPLPVTDSFNRANSTGLGTADTGQVWAVDQGGFDVLSNQAHSRTLGNNLQSIEGGSLDMRVQATIVAFSDQGSAIVGRLTSSLDQIRLRWIGSQLILLDVVAGAATVQGTVAYVPSPGDVARLDIAGTTVQAFINGVLKITATTAVVGGTRGGLHTSENEGVFDDFSLLPLGPAMMAVAVASGSGLALRGGGGTVVAAAAAVGDSTPYVLDGVGAVAASAQVVGPGRVIGVGSGTPSGAAQLGGDGRAIRPGSATAAGASGVSGGGLRLGVGSGALTAGGAMSGLGQRIPRFVVSAVPAAAAAVTVTPAAAAAVSVVQPGLAAITPNAPN